MKFPGLCKVGDGSSGVAMGEVNAPRLSVNVGVTTADRDTGPNNRMELREAYASHTAVRGYRAMCRGDSLEGKRVELYHARVPEEQKHKLGTERSRHIQKLRKLERRGLLIEAIVDLVPSLFYSGWRVISFRFK